MPRLYIDEYTRALAGRTVCIACREGILRDFFLAVVDDVKFLNRKNIQTVLYHNIPNRFANQKYFRILAERLPETRIVRLPPEVDIYSHILDHEQDVYKLIFLERKPLVDQQGQRINAVNTNGVRQSINTWSDLISNLNFKSALERICSMIDSGRCERVHILPASKNAIRHELFTIEGCGTLIANNFVETFQPVSSDADVRIINGILKLYRHEGYLKPRTESYLYENKDNFYVTMIDDIVVGCVEKKLVDPDTVEIAALAISNKFRNQRLGVFTIQAFMQCMRGQGFRRFISLTNNPSLRHLYEMLGFAVCRHAEYGQRQAASPNVTMYFKEFPRAVIRLN